MDSFLTACGAIGPIVLEIKGPGDKGIERREFLQPFVLIGRDARADLVLDHDLVSRRHTYLQLIEGRVFFVDLESRSGTMVGAAPSESAWLAPGDAFEVGPYTIRLAPFEGNDVGFEFHALAKDSSGDGGIPLNPLLARSSDAADLPRVSLEFQSKTAGHSVWRMSQVLALVGSSPRCKVRLLDSNVSKLHCSLFRSSQGLWVIDLLGRGGITVNGASVRFARLGSDDVLGLGQVVVRPNFDDPFGTRLNNAPGASGMWGSPPGLPAVAPAPAFPDRVPRPWGFQATPAGQAPAYYNAPRPPAPTEVAAADPALSMLLSHFGQMQQQMIDQFQTSMMMMLQMFNGMHQEQMGLVRDELDRLRELNSEVQQLKAQISANPPQGQVSPASQPPATPSANPWPGFGRNTPGRPVAPPKTEPLRGANSPSPNGPRASNSNGSVPPGGSPTPAKPFAQRPQNWPAPAPAGGILPPRTPETVDLPAPADSEGEVHDWLNDRLVAITQEQQNLWQKIMGLMRGNSK
jgi:Inner membrane component of T3SS, cytoplasmic domain/FHA domain